MVWPLKDTVTEPLVGSPFTVRMLLNQIKYSPAMEVLLKLDWIELGDGVHAIDPGLNLLI